MRPTLGEHDSEPVRGLPAPLPSGETLLWQGAPDWRALALNAFRVRALAIYFGLIVLARAAWLIGGGATLAEAIAGAAGPAVLSLACLAILTAIAWASARATVYTVTSRRVVIRQGVALSATVNIPFASIESASLRPRAAGRGDIALRTVREQRISYALLWPHVRPWRITRPEPSLRCIDDAEAVARLLTRAFTSVVPESQTARLGASGPNATHSRGTTPATA